MLLEAGHAAARAKGERLDRREDVYIRSKVCQRRWKGNEGGTDAQNWPGRPGIFLEVKAASSRSLHL